MKEGETHSVMVESNRHIDPPRRRSPRLSSTLQPPGKIDTNMAALEAIPVKRSITLRKIAPRKTVTSAEQDKENTPRRTSNRLGQKKEKVSTPDLVPDRRASAISSAKKKKQASMPSPILPSSPPTSNPAEQPPATPEDAEWARKHLQTPEVNRAAGQSRSALELSSISALNSFTSLLDTDAGGAAEPDPNIPGVAVVKERKRRRKKVAPIDGVELDVLVAQMNAEFQEAEEFELVVE
uniref:Sororin C-terminal region domain-containing protein n=1 Tax=Oryzias sinensis TaxID=183150 RepID=A0A8C8E2Z5_9TELE